MKTRHIAEFFGISITPLLCSVLFVTQSFAGDFKLQRSDLEIVNAATEQFEMKGEVSYLGHLDQGRVYLEVASKSNLWRGETYEDKHGQVIVRVQQFNDNMHPNVKSTIIENIRLALPKRTVFIIKVDDNEYGQGSDIGLNHVECVQLSIVFNFRDGNSKALFDKVIQIISENIRFDKDLLDKLNRQLKGEAIERQITRDEKTNIVSKLSNEYSIKRMLEGDQAAGKWFNEQLAIEEQKLLGTWVQSKASDSTTAKISPVERISNRRPVVASFGSDNDSSSHKPIAFQAQPKAEDIERGPAFGNANSNSNFGSSLEKEFEQRRQQFEAKNQQFQQEWQKNWNSFGKF